jgi:hypothetical protein
MNGYHLPEKHQDQYLILQIRKHNIPKLIENDMLNFFSKIDQKKIIYTNHIQNGLAIHLSKIIDKRLPIPENIEIDMHFSELIGFEEVY